MRDRHEGEKQARHLGFEFTRTDVLLALGPFEKGLLRPDRGSWPLDLVPAALADIQARRAYGFHYDSLTEGPVLLSPKDVYRLTVLLKEGSLDWNREAGLAGGKVNRPLRELGFLVTSDDEVAETGEAS